MNPEHTSHEYTDTITDTTSSTPNENPTIDHVVGVRLPVEIGNFSLHLFTDEEEKEHLALVKGEVKGKGEVLTRIHSECLTGDLFGSMRCDCGPQLRQSMKMIEEEGQGLVIYLRQEGRGIGLAEKLKAYNLQDLGYDTVDANIRLGHKGEERDYQIAADILNQLGVISVRLLSNNPDKINSLRDYGIAIDSRIPLNPPVHHENVRYLKTKVDRMDHELDFNLLSPSTPEREEILRYVKKHLSGKKANEDKTNEGKTNEWKANEGMANKEMANEGMTTEAGKDEVFITLSYFQGLEGCVANPDPNSIGGVRDNLIFKGQLRQIHDAHVIDSSSFMALEPSIIKIFPEGFDSIPIIINSEGSMNTGFLDHLNSYVQSVSQDGQESGAENVPKVYVILPENSVIPDDPAMEGLVILPLVDSVGSLDLAGLKASLQKEGITSLVVEGPRDTISEIINRQEADLIISTVLPCFLGSTTECYGTGQSEGVKGDYCMDGFRYNKLGGELVYYGKPDWS